jgi:hypothetical protein
VFLAFIVLEVLGGGHAVGDCESTGRSSGRRPAGDEPAGVFAVGDVRHGSVKRVASGVGEGSICIRLSTSTLI